MIYINFFILLGNSKYGNGGMKYTIFYLKYSFLYLGDAGNAGNAGTVTGKKELQHL